MSHLSITSISIDHFLIVAYPIKHRVLIKGKVIVLWLAAIWIMSSVFPASTTFSKRSMLIRESVFGIFTVVIMVLSSILYFSTCYKLKKQSRNTTLQNSTESRAQEIRTLKERRFFKTIMIIACVAFRLYCTCYVILYFQ